MVFITWEVLSFTDTRSLLIFLRIVFLLMPYTKTIKRSAARTPAPVPIVAPAAPQLCITSSPFPLWEEIIREDMRRAKTATNICSMIWDREVGIMFLYA